MHFKDRLPVLMIVFVELQLNIIDPPPPPPWWTLLASEGPSSDHIWAEGERSVMRHQTGFSKTELKNWNLDKLVPANKLHLQWIQVLLQRSVVIKKRPAFQSPNLGVTSLSFIYPSQVFPSWSGDLKMPNSMLATGPNLKWVNCDPHVCRKHFSMLKRLVELHRVVSLCDTVLQ